MSPGWDICFYKIQLYAYCSVNHWLHAGGLTTRTVKSPTVHFINMDGYQSEIYYLVQDRVLLSLQRERQ